MFKPSQNTQAVSYLVGFTAQGSQQGLAPGAGENPPLSPQTSSPVTSFSSAWSFSSCRLGVHSCLSLTLTASLGIYLSPAAKALGSSYPLTNGADPAWSLPKKPGKSLSRLQQALGHEGRLLLLGQALEPAVGRQKGVPKPCLGEDVGPIVGLSCLWNVGTSISPKKLFWAGQAVPSSQRGLSPPWPLWRCWELQAVSKGTHW